MDFAFALAAALLFAFGTVLQQRVATTVSDDDAMKAGLLIRLAKRPLWVVGIAADSLGFLFQAAALAVGRLTVVQPLLASSVVFALPIAAKLDGRRVNRNDINGAIAVTGGLALFLVLADPTGGVDNASALGWIVTGVVAAVLCGTLVVASKGRRPSSRAALLGTAAGILFGISAALTKAVVDQLGDGLFSIFTDWHLYGLIVVGWISMTLSQQSLQTGKLAPAMATQMSFDPIASVLLGTLVFDEKIADTPLELAFAVVGIFAMVAGLVMLARSQASHASRSAPATTG